METYITKNGQNIWDVCIKLYGSVEGVFDLLISNQGLSLYDGVKGGMKLNYHPSYIAEQSVVDEISDNGYPCANGERSVYHKTVSYPLMFLCNMQVERAVSGFSASSVKGWQTLQIDWGDNSPVEEYTFPAENVVREFEHYFDNKVDDIRQMKVYGNAEFMMLDITSLGGMIRPVKPIVVQELVDDSNGHGLDGLFLMEETYSVSLQKCTISDLKPLIPMSLQTLNLTGVKYVPETVLDEYLVGLLNSGSRRGCTVYLTSQPTKIGMDVIKQIISEPEWNTAGKWLFNINGTIYTAT